MTTPNWAANDFIIKEAVVGGASVAAVSRQGEMLAVRLGVVRSRRMWATRLGDKICVRQTCETCATAQHFFYLYLLLVEIIVWLARKPSNLKSPLTCLTRG